MLAKLYDLLFKLVLKEKRTPKKGSRQRLGHDFEDSVYKIIWEWANTSNAQPLPPRHTLVLPTISGHTYQFDAGYKSGNTYHLFECKRVKMSVTENVHYFTSKIIDYQYKMDPNISPNEFQGTFISNSEVGDQSLEYALAYGITVVDPETPPLELILSTKIEENLKIVIKDFLDSLPNLKNVLCHGYKLNINSKELCKKYRFYTLRWKNEIEKDYETTQS